MNPVNHQAGYTAVVKAPKRKAATLSDDSDSRPASDTQQDSFHASKRQKTASFSEYIEEVSGFKKLKDEALEDMNKRPEPLPKSQDIYQQIAQEMIKNPEHVAKMALEPGYQGALAKAIQLRSQLTETHGRYRSKIEFQDISTLELFHSKTILQNSSSRSKNRCRKAV